MPRINIPQRQVRASGSSGVKADVDISSPQFSAVQRLGANVEGLADQKFDEGIKQQRHVDEGASAGYLRDNKVFFNALATNLEEPGVANNHKRQSEVAQGAFQERRLALSNQLAEDGVSASRKRKLLENFDATEENYGITLKKKFLIEDREKANANKLGLSEELYKEGNQSEADAVVDGMEVSEAEKIQYKNRGKDVFELENKRRAAAVMSEAQLRMNGTRDAVEIDRISEEAKGKLNDEQSERVDLASNYRKDTIAREDFSMIGTQVSFESGIISRIERGQFFTNEKIQSLAIDEAAKDILVKVGDELKPGLGQSSSEYKAFLNSINAKFAENPFGQVGPKEVSTEQYEEIYKGIENGPWDTSSKMSLMSHVMKMRAVDARTDKDLFGFFQTKETPDGTVRVIADQEIPIDNGQAEMLKAASLDLASKLAVSNGRIVADKTGMTYTDFVDLIFDLQEPALIDKFQKLEPGSKEYNEMYDNEVRAKIVDKQKKTSIQLLRDRILGLRGQQLGLREDIASAR